MELDASEGLLLGQHVYLELETGDEEETNYPSIDGAFLCYAEDGSNYVWAENNGKLEKRTVTVGEFDYMRGTVEILEGLTEEDYIAFPNEELCGEGAPTTRNEPVQEMVEGANA